MSSTGDTILNAAHLSRSDLEQAFCGRLSDDCLRLSAGAKFDALLLWKQRDAAYDEIVRCGGSVPEVMP